jgi:hypothetical protein
MRRERERNRRKITGGEGHYGSSKRSKEFGTAAFKLETMGDAKHKSAGGYEGMRKGNRKEEEFTPA